MDCNLEEINSHLEYKTTTEMLQWCYSFFEKKKITLSTSFGSEGMILLDMLVRLGMEVKVFTIDTGRNFNETYTIWQEVIVKYKITIDVYSPDPDDVSGLIKGKGPNLFYKDKSDRKACCYIRKVKPLKRALAGTDIWMSGLRRNQSVDRHDIDILSFSEEYKVYKFCPLAKWSEANVWEYIRNNNVPYNKLYDLGYPTIGCQPCSRPVRPAEDIRSGRWWWEDGQVKECGIHFEDGKVVSKKDDLNWSI